MPAETRRTGARGYVWSHHHYVPIIASGSMQPFSVTCETCGARLRVRDASLVGEIHACPKCSSMVLIAMPASEPSAAAPNPGSTSLRADEASVAEPHSPAPEPAPADEFLAEVDHLLQTRAAADTSQGLDDSVPDSSPDVVNDIVEGGAATGASATGSSTLLWSVVGATSVIVVLLGGVIWWTSDRGAPTPEVAVAAAPANSHSTSPGSSTTADGPVHEQDPTAPVLEEEEAQQVQQVQKPTIAETPTPLPELPPVPSTPQESSAATASGQSATDGKTSAEASADEPPPKSSTPAIPEFIDPLGVNPADLDLLLVPKPPTAPSPPGSSAGKAQDDQAEPVHALPDEEDPLDRPAQVRRFEPGSSTLGPSFTEEFAPGTFEKRLAMRIPAIRWSGTPLSRVLSELSQLSGIPIQVDPETLRMAPSRASHRITLSQQDATLDSVIHQLATSMRLKVVRVDDQLHLVKPDVDMDREVSYRVEDLASNEAALQQLIELVEQFALEPASNAKIRHTSGEIVISQPARHQYDVLLFLERYRKARGFVPRSKYPTDLISVEPRLVSLKERLARATTFAIVDWTPLCDVFDYWQSSSQLHFLVDWRQLAEIDRRLLTTMAGSAEQLPWGRALDACLSPLKLSWIPVDEETLQITTAAAAAEHRWVEFYPVDKLTQLASRSRSAAGLRESLAERCDANSMVHAILADDPVGNLILVRGNRDVHQEILGLIAIE